MKLVVHIDVYQVYINTHYYTCIGNTYRLQLDVDVHTCTCILCIYDVYLCTCVGCFTPVCDSQTRSRTDRPLLHTVHTTTVCSSEVVMVTDRAGLLSYNTVKVNYHARTVSLYIYIKLGEQNVSFISVENIDE